MKFSNQIFKGRLIVQDIANTGGLHLSSASCLTNSTKYFEHFITSVPSYTMNGNI